MIVALYAEHLQIRVTHALKNSWLYSRYIGDESHIKMGKLFDKLARKIIEKLGESDEGKALKYIISLDYSK